MSRREIRDQIFKILFRIEFYDKEELLKQLEFCMDEIGDAESEDKEYIHNKVVDVYTHLEAIDEMINGIADKWKTTRMAKAELTIIRLAVYEMKYEDDIPVSVAINEAVELAKVYGADNGPKFVNGVLAKIA